MSWTVQFTRRAQKDLKRLDQQTQARVTSALRKLAEADEGDVVKLRDVEPPGWRLRVGDWRIRLAYIAQEQAILVLRVLPRGKAHDH